MPQAGRSSFFALLAAFGLAVSVVAVSYAPPAEAQRNNDDDEDEQRSSNRTFSAKVGQKVSEAQEIATAEGAVPEVAYPQAIAKLNEALETRGISPYELGVTLMLRGSYRYQIDDLQGAITDFQRSLDDGDLGPEERLNVRHNLGQFYLLDEQYRRAIDILEQYIADGGDAGEGTHRNLVGAYAELDDYPNALRHALLAYQKADPPERVHYDQLNYLYAELNMPRERADLLVEMVALFPTDRSIWTTIAALRAQSGQEREAFEINKIMYLNGMFTEEDEILRIADFYSYYEVPYRGARILEREMNRGRVRRNLDNYKRLARFYRQAHEFDKAIAPLQQAARLEDSGILFHQLGEALYAEGRMGESEASLLSALEKGGLEEPGNVWVLVGNARYENTEVDEGERRLAAIEAFEEAVKYPYARRQAAGWIEFVKGEISAAEQRATFTERVIFDEKRVACERRAATVLMGDDAAPVLDREGNEVDCDEIMAQYNAQLATEAG